MSQTAVHAGSTGLGVDGRRRFGGDAVANVFLVATAVLGVVATAIGGSVSLGPGLDAAFAGLIVGGLVAALDDVLFLFRPTAAAGRSGR